MTDSTGQREETGGFENVPVRPNTRSKATEVNAAKAAKTTKVSAKVKAALENGFGIPLFAVADTRYERIPARARYVLPLSECLRYPRYEDSLARFPGHSRIASWSELRFRRSAKRIPKRWKYPTNRTHRRTLWREIFLGWSVSPRESLRKVRILGTVAESASFDSERRTKSST